MDPIPCLGCGTFLNRETNFRATVPIQRARKALWQRQKLANDSEYAQSQKLSNNKWLENNPNYWKGYR